ncbi:MAG TPA: hypothetical protein VI197_32755, partial [Polyangiaceae bacterium]
MTPVFESRCWPCLVLALAGCAVDRGRGFAKLETANLEVSLEARGDTGDAELLTDLGYEINVERATVRVRRWELQEAISQAREVEGDAHDHGEEAHEHDEKARDHDEDEHDEHAAVQGYAALVTLGFDAAISLTAHHAVAADRYDPSPELARSSPERVLLGLERFEFDGTVSGGDLASGVAALTVELPLDTELVASFETFAIAQDGPESVRLETTVSVHESLFDGIDFAALEVKSRVLIEDPYAPAALALTTALAGSET